MPRSAAVMSALLLLLDTPQVARNLTGGVAPADTAATIGATATTTGATATTTGAIAMKIGAADMEQLAANPRPRGVAVLRADILVAIQAVP